MIDISTPKRILLFLNASSNRLARHAKYFDDSFLNTKPIGFAFNYLIEFCIFNLLRISTDQLPYTCVTILLMSPFLVHGIIDFIFSNDLKLIEQDYNKYYRSYYYNIYCALVIIGVLYGIYYMFNS